MVDLSAFATLSPPIAPMLGKVVRELPRGDYVYEPKWDGFRCLAFRRGMELELQSRHGRPLTRYFPEIVEALNTVPADEFIVDGELVVVRDGRFDFAALLGRIHPAAAHVARMRGEAPAAFIAFDALEVRGRDLMTAPFVERRAALEDLLGGVDPPLYVTPATSDPTVAERWLARYQGAGVDGVMAKPRDLRYEPGKRAMLKVKHEQTADCVVAGMRPSLDGRRLVASLLLGLYDADDRKLLEHIGVVSAFPMHQRAALFEDLAELVVPLEGHPWEHGFNTAGGSLGRLAGSAGRWTPDMSHDWLPLRPERVVEVAYDQVDGTRLRHPARFRRWRPDREPESCTTDQLVPADPDVAGLLRV